VLYVKKTVTLRTTDMDLKVTDKTLADVHHTSHHTN